MLRSPILTALLLVIGLVVLGNGAAKYHDATDAISHEEGVRASLLSTESILKDPSSTRTLLSSAQAKTEHGKAAQSLRDRVRQAAAETGAQLNDTQESRQKLSVGEETVLTLTFHEVAQDRLARLVSAIESGKALSPDASPPIVSEIILKPSIEGVRYIYKEARLVVRSRTEAAP